MQKYDHKKIEKKWQKFWATNKIYTTPDTVPGKDNFYLLVEFPYPSGNLHVGHWYAFATPDVLARVKRMQGKNVLYPIGFDAFGLPAENAAIKRGINPRKWTKSNIAYMKKQIASMGASFDWSREVQTIDPQYYKWTQWMFLQFFKNGLAYQKETAVNWCPKDKTVLANEQVIDGKCERCGTEVIQREMLQWNLKITDYADRLVDDLDALDWPEQIKESQRNWIGRSEGYEIDFPLDLGIRYKYVLLHGFNGSPDMPRFRYWKEELEKLGHEVIIPSLPNSNEPSEDEQVSAALAATDYDEHTVLFGHSLGAVVAMKVVERLKSPIGRLVLAAGFADPDFKDKRRNFEKRFSWTFDVPKIKATVPIIQILNDSADSAVSHEQSQRLEDLLGVKATTVKGEAPHFNGPKEATVLMWLRATIRVFTTRPDTLFGATYVVLAPEHPWMKRALSHKGLFGNEQAVEEYIALSGKKTELERQVDQKDKTGVELKGVKAIHPATGKAIPLFIADYVLAQYGTGAVMGVPAHDARDYAFAKTFGLPIVDVIEPRIVQKTGLDAFRADATKDRHSVLAVTKHWSEEKYLAVQYKPTDVRGFVSGGIEEGEDIATTATREIREETGYTSARFVRKLGGTIHSNYYSLKYGNLHVLFSPLFMQLENDSRDEISQKEKDEHNVSWMTKPELETFLNRGDMRIAWNRLLGNGLYDGDGVLCNSEKFNGLTTEEGKRALGEKFGRKKTTFKLRDWIVSRQRYWGVPIPIIHCLSCGAVPVPDKDLPVKLPEVKDYLPEGSGKSPLAKVKKFVQVKCPQCKGKAKRETDTFDTFVDSSWYFLRYTDPKNKKKFADKKKLEQWMPVDLYLGGAEHTTVHVLFSRFWQKALYDLGLVADAEPYIRRMNRSIILGPDHQKMSKSHGNVIDPDEVVSQLGADTVRMYLAFIGPYNEVGTYPWNPDGVVGMRRFLERVWRAQEFVGKTDNPALENPLHKTVKKVGEDISALKFNTAISALMIFLNAVDKEKALGQNQWGRFLKLLAPFAPHITEELWSVSGQKKSIHKAVWPEFDVAYLKSETTQIAVQINGKTRGQASVAEGADKVVQEAAAKDAVGEKLRGKKIVRTIVVPGRLVNFVLE